MRGIFDLTNKVAIITGGTGVLGGAMAQGLAEVGARVAILGRREAKAMEVALNIEENGGSAMALPADVLDKESLKTAKKRILEQWGTIDILINAAGGNVKEATVNPDQSFADLECEHLKKVIELNQLGTILPSLVFSGPMIERKKGVIINISSMAAQRAITRVIGYSAAKAGIDNFTKWLAVEMAQKYGEGIRVNAIAPGFFIGEQNENLLLNSDKSLSSRSKKIITNTPMGRFGKPQELIGTLIWLCSEASGFVTGVVVPVDGGFSAYSGV